MGQKPLFYGELPGGGLAFGSEPKAVLAHPGIGRALDHASLARYLFYEYVPAPHSIWRSLQKLPRGHALCWEAGSIPRLADTGTRPIRLAARARLRDDGRAILDRASRLGRAAPALGRADRRLSLRRHRFLERRRRALRGRARTERPHFSIGFEDPSFDESRHARAVARHLGTDHHERTFSIETVYELLPQVARWLDEPFGDASILPTIS